MGRPVRAETPDVIKWRNDWDAGNGQRWCPGMSTTSDAYRNGWERIFGNARKKAGQ